MKYLNKIKAGHTLKRSEIFFVIEELRLLDFGITLGTLGDFQYSAEYVFWPLVNDIPHGAIEITHKLEANTPEAVIQNIALRAMAHLKELQPSINDLKK